MNCFSCVIVFILGNRVNVNIALEHNERISYNSVLFSQIRTYHPLTGRIKNRESKLIAP